MTGVADDLVGVAGDAGELGVGAGAEFTGPADELVLLGVDAALAEDGGGEADAVGGDVVAGVSDPLLTRGAEDLAYSGLGVEGEAGTASFLGAGTRDHLVEDGDAGCALAGGVGGRASVGDAGGANLVLACGAGEGS